MVTRAPKAAKIAVNSKILKKGALMRIIPDSAWNEIKKVIPVKKSNIGRPPWCDKKTLEGILLIVKTGMQWKFLPKEFGKVSTVHGKFRKWVKMGVFEKIMQNAKILYIKSLDQPITWFASDTSHSKAPLANNWSGKNPTDRGKRGVKRSIIVDLKGAPLAVYTGPSNKHDINFFEKTFCNLNFGKTQIARVMEVDSAYDCKHARQVCKKDNFCLLAATNIRRSKNKKIYKTFFRWIVERTFGWQSWYRGIKTCWAKAEDSYIAFLQLVSSVQLFKLGGLFV